MVKWPATAKSLVEHIAYITFHKRFVCPTYGLIIMTPYNIIMYGI